MKNFFPLSFFILFLFIIISFISIISVYYNNYPCNSASIDKNYYFSNSEFFWPIPGYHTITSYFGKRISPTDGASSNHSGIDISATEGTAIFSILSGKVIYTDFYGANGYTIIIQSEPYTIQYSHISPNYIVNKRRFNS